MTLMWRLCDVNVLFWKIRPQFQYGTVPYAYLGGGFFLTRKWIQILIKMYTSTGIEYLFRGGNELFFSSWGILKSGFEIKSL